MPADELLLRSTKARLFTEKDLVGFYQVTQALMSHEEQKDFVYVALGRSPAILVEFMRQHFGVTVLDLPLGGLSDGTTAELTPSVQLLLKRFLPISAIKNKIVVLIDYAHSGKSLLQVRQLVEDYANKLLSPFETIRVMTAPISSKTSILKGEHSVMSGFDPETRAAHRMLKILFTEIDKDIYGPVKSVKYKDIKDSSENVPENLSVIEVRENRMALEEAMKLALKFKPDDFSVSDYLLPRKEKTKRFSYTSFGYGYDRSKLQEENWVNNLRARSLDAYKLSLALDKYIDEEAREGNKQRELDRKNRALEKQKMDDIYFRRRVIAAGILLLFVYGVYYLCSSLYQRFMK